jgi:hypothetical protein
MARAAGWHDFAVMRRRAVVVGLVASSLVFLIGGATAASALGRSGIRPRQTTTVSAETTTTLAPTTTTLAPTTTTAAPTTTSSSTSTSTTTTTVAPKPSSGGSSTPWGWIIGILAVVAVGLIIALILMRRSSQQSKHEWQAAAASALPDAELTRDMLEGEARPGEPEDPARHNEVREKVDRVSTRFDQLATDAPNDDARRYAASVASSLRGYLFALEAEQLLRNAPTTPTADQLAAADATHRTRATDLDAALGALRAYVDPESQSRRPT